MRKRVTPEEYPADGHQKERDPDVGEEGKSLLPLQPEGPVSHQYQAVETAPYDEIP